MAPSFHLLQLQANDIIHFMMQRIYLFQVNKHWKQYINNEIFVYSEYVMHACIAIQVWSY